MRKMYCDKPGQAAMRYSSLRAQYHWRCRLHVLRLRGWSCTVVRIQHYSIREDIYRYRPIDHASVRHAENKNEKQWCSAQLRSFPLFAVHGLLLFWLVTAATKTWSARPWSQVQKFLEQCSYSHREQAIHRPRINLYPQRFERVGLARREQDHQTLWCQELRQRRRIHWLVGDYGWRRRPSPWYIFSVTRCSTFWKMCIWLNTRTWPWCTGPTTLEDWARTISFVPPRWTSCGRST